MHVVLFQGQIHLSQATISVYVSNGLMVPPEIHTNA